MHLKKARGGLEFSASDCLVIGIVFEKKTFIFETVMMTG